MFLFGLIFKLKQYSILKTILYSHNNIRFKKQQLLNSLEWKY